MQILIVGGGDVGSSIAADLADRHEVVVVDADRDRVDELRQSLDVLAVQGDGTSIDTLEDAGVGDADVAIAATHDDETNLAVCGTVASVSDAFTVGQVAKTTYLRTWRRSRGVFGADFVVSSELLAARAIAAIVDLPMAHDVEEFAAGEVQVAEFEVVEDSPVVGRPLDECTELDAVRAAAAIRDGDVVTRDEAADVAPGDRVVTVGPPAAIETFATRITPPDYSFSVSDVVILGASPTAKQVARLLEEQDRQPRLVTGDHTRARELADDLPETTVLVHDPTDPDFLRRENVGDADVAVVSPPSDQASLLASMLARRQGVDRTVTVVNAAEYDDLFEAAGVDVAVRPRDESAEEIARFTRERRAENVVVVEHGVGEVFEVEVTSESLAAGRTVADVEESLPRGVTVGAVTRDRDHVAPAPDVELRADDHVVLFTPADVRDEAVSQI